MPGETFSQLARGVGLGAVLHCQGLELTGMQHPGLHRCLVWRGDAQSSPGLRMGVFGSSSTMGHIIPPTLNTGPEAQPGNTLLSPYKHPEPNLSMAEYAFTFTPEKAPTTRPAQGGLMGRSLPRWMAKVHPWGQVEPDKTRFLCNSFLRHGPT